VGAGVWNEITESRKLVRSLRLPLVIRPVRRTYVVVSDEVLIAQVRKSLLFANNLDLFSSFILLVATTENMPLDLR